MRSIRPVVLAAVLPVLWLAAPAVARDGVHAPEQRELVVMSFNIRYGTAKDGENSWDRRRELLFDVLRDVQADIVGMQEGLHFQLTEIMGAVPRYRSVGVARDDGAEAGEYSNIMYAHERLEATESGTFWFSDTPGVPASRSWGNRIPRICTWARFRLRDTGATVLVYNVHLDHESQPSRERSVVAMVEDILRRRRTGEAIVVTGDFNADEGNRAMRWLLGSEPIDGMPPRPDGLRLMDTFRRRHPDATGVGTFTGFRFGEIDEQKIDYVLVEPGTEVLDAQILHTSRDGRYPSDHFPVTARIRLR